MVFNRISTRPWFLLRKILMNPWASSSLLVSFSKALPSYRLQTTYLITITSSQWNRKIISRAAPGRVAGFPTTGCTQGKMRRTGVSRRPRLCRISVVWDYLVRINAWMISWAARWSPLWRSICKALSCKKTNHRLRTTWGNLQSSNYKTQAARLELATTTRCSDLKFVHLCMGQGQILISISTDRVFFRLKSF